MKRRHVIAGIALSLFLAASSAQAGVDTQGINFQGINFQGINFQGINFQGINFQGVDANGINFQGINFQGINFQGITFQGSELVMTEMGWSDDGQQFEYHRRKVDGWSHWVWENNTVTDLGSGTGLLSQIGATFDVQVYTDSRIPVTYTARIAGAKWLNDANNPYDPDDPDNPTAWNSMTRFENGAHASNADVAVYDIEILMPTGRTSFVPVGLCDHSTGYGMFVKGRWGADGAYTPEGISFACDGPSGGVIAKCISQWGYKPWKALHIDDSNQWQNLGTLHRSCVRAARADYCGDGTTFTKNGTPVDILDTYGFNVWAFYDEIVAFETEFCVDLSLEMESIFDENGTVFHNEERYGDAELMLPCANGAPPGAQFGDDQWDLWGFFGENLYGEPLIAVRSDPVTTWWYWETPLGQDLASFGEPINLELLDNPQYDPPPDSEICP